MSPRRPRNEVLALLLTPKWIALTVLVIGLSVVFAIASSWQYSRAMHQVNAQRAAASQPVPVAELVPTGTDLPAAALGRLAVAQGEYVADAWVVGRTSPAGQPGVWLVSALDDGSGLLTPVLRGWLPDRSAEPGPAGQVEVTGRISSEENFYQDVAAGADDELVAITDERLAQIWDRPLRPGYLVLDAQVPVLGAGDPQPVPPVFGTDSSVGFPWQNAGYALQWITFIGFVGFMYWRFFRDDLRARRGEQVPGSDLVAADVP